MRAVPAVNQMTYYVCSSWWNQPDFLMDLYGTSVNLKIKFATYEMPCFQWAVQDPRIESAPRSFLIFGPALCDRLDIGFLLRKVLHAVALLRGQSTRILSIGPQTSEDHGQKTWFSLQVFIKVRTRYCKGRANTLYKQDHPRFSYAIWTWVCFTFLSTFNGLQGAVSYVFWWFLMSVCYLCTCIPSIIIYRLYICAKIKGTKSLDSKLFVPLIFAQMYSLYIIIYTHNVTWL